MSAQSAQIHEFKGQLAWSKCCFRKTYRIIRDSRWFPSTEERCPEEPCAKANLPCQLRAFGATSHGGSKKKVSGLKMGGDPRPLGAWAPKRRNPASSSWGLGILSFLHFYLFLSCLHLRSWGAWGCKVMKLGGWRVSSVAKAKIMFDFEWNLRQLWVDLTWRGPTIIWHSLGFLAIEKII